jgi:hypothetical protein
MMIVASINVFGSEATCLQGVRAGLLGLDSAANEVNSEAATNQLHHNQVDPSDRKLSLSLRREPACFSVRSIHFFRKNLINFPTL